MLDIQGNYRHLDEQKEIIIFRILQETLSNIVRHAAAKQIIILLSYLADHISLFIQDNGRGFDRLSLLAKPFTKHTASGINNMMKRAKMINAELDIKSNPGNGTTVTIFIPYQIK